MLDIVCFLLVVRFKHKLYIVLAGGCWNNKLIYCVVISPSLFFFFFLGVFFCLFRWFSGCALPVRLVPSSGFSALLFLPLHLLVSHWFKKKNCVVICCCCWSIQQKNLCVPFFSPFLRAMLKFVQKNCCAQTLYKIC